MFFEYKNIGRVLSLNTNNERKKIFFFVKIRVAKKFKFLVLNAGYKSNTIFQQSFSRSDEVWFYH